MSTTIKWLTLFKSQSQPIAPEEMARMILGNIDGYGVEYGFNQDEDAQDLLEAFAAMKIWYQDHPPVKD